MPTPSQSLYRLPPGDCSSRRVSVQEDICKPSAALTRLFVRRRVFGGNAEHKKKASVVLFSSDSNSVSFNNNKNSQHSCKKKKGAVNTVSSSGRVRFRVCSREGGNGGKEGDMQNNIHAVYFR